jgi:hypothetical protein
MADILRFQKRESERERRPHALAGEIIIFPGIRIEYHDPAPRPPAKRRTRRSKRNVADDALSA